MTFELVRINWPNTAAILALAVMPAVALATLAPSRLPAAEAFAIADATNCPLPAADDGRIGHRRHLIAGIASAAPI